MYTHLVQQGLILTYVTSTPCVFVLRATGSEKNTKVDYAQLHSYSLTYLLRRRVTIPDVVEPRPFLSFTQPRPFLSFTKDLEYSYEYSYGVRGKVDHLNQQYEYQ